MPYDEAKSFGPGLLGVEQQSLLRAAMSDGRVSAFLTDDGPYGQDGLARYAVLEGLCARGLLAYDGGDGSGDDLELGFVLTEAGQSYLNALGA